MQKLLVIGATGLLGNRLMELAKGRYEVYGTRNANGSDAANVQRLDVCDRESILSFIERLRPDCVVDTHALTNLDYCEVHQEETWHVNVDGAMNAAEATRRIGAKYIFLSTDYVFDGTKPIYKEDDATNPLCYYAKTKFAVEQKLSAMDIDHIIARTTVLYGVGGIGKVSFAIWLINKLKAREKVNIVMDQSNCPTFTDNLSELILKLYEKDETGIFHTAGKECINRYDFSMRIAETFDLDKSLINPVTTAELKQVAPKPRVVNVSTEKVERATGIKTLTVKEGLSLFREQMR